jgi:hypothetical protein
MNIRALILCAPVVLLPFSMKANTFTVTVTSDIGTGSLRQAIVAANQNPGPDTIVFNIPVNDPGFNGTVFTIKPLSALPPLTDANTTIDGATQTAFTGDTNPSGPEVVLNGSQVGFVGGGLTINSSGNVINGLVVNGFNNTGVQISGTGATFNKVTGCYLGTNPTGDAAVPNTFDGLAIDGGASNNTIGGSSAAERNLISGNLRNGLLILDHVGSGSDNNIVQGNFIGTDAMGQTALGNSQQGTTQGGIQIGPNAHGNLVGGTIAGVRNIISGNASLGVYLASGNDVSNNQVQGNFIGTDVTGTLSVGNQGPGGVGLFSTSPNTIGGTTSGAQNVISGNLSSGIHCNGCQNQVVQGNVISTNAGDGVTLFSQLNDALNNAILSNSIYNNGGLGIDLGGDGVTPNDPGDTDTGPNNLQNYPILTSVTNGGGNTSIAGRLNSAANTSYRIEFFANDTIDPSGFGEGQSFVGFTNATTDGSGNVSFNASVPQIAAGRQVTATATDPNGNTSEFSAAFGAPVITSPLTATATQGQLFVYQVIATGTPTSYTATPLPTGLSFDSDNGILGGSPTNPGTTQIQLTASNSFGTGTATLTLTVQPAPNSGPVVMSGTSITARTGDLFSFEVFTTGGSTTARLAATGLPPGLSADSVTGVISGTPTTDGSFGVTLTVTEGAVTFTSTLQLTFTSDPAIPVITSPREAGLTVGQPFTYTITTDSSDQSGTTFSLIGSLPPGLGFDPATGIISGTYNPGFQNGGALLGNVQTNTNNSSGSGTNPLSFFQGVTATAVNISTRLAVGTSDIDWLIGGFIVTGNAPKKVLVRAIGPSLQYNGTPIVGRLLDPKLELHDNRTPTAPPIATNDDWHTTQIGGLITADQSAAIQATLAPTDSRESAMIVTLTPNNGDPNSLTGHYTAIVSGKNGTTGIALVEFYDLGTASLEVSSNAQLANISTRGLVQTGDDVMIGGFIVQGLQGDMPATVIVRAIGPSLAQSGITDPLQDPTLELHDGTGAIIKSDDNWQDDPGAGQIQTDNLAPTDPRESATIVTLEPGNYTAIVRGANGTTGVALVEAYVLP